MTTLHKIRNLVRQWEDQKITSIELACDIAELLPTKEVEKDRKVKHNYAWFLTGNGCEECKALKPSPSPLDEIDYIILTGRTADDILKIVDKLNEIINYLKSK